jgi:hypothetical protein
MIRCSFDGELDEVTFNARVLPVDAASLGRTTNQYLDNDFSRARFSHVAFRGGVDLSRQVLPDRSTHLQLSEPAIIAAVNDVNGWEDEEQRRAALAFLKVLLQDLHSGQHTVLISPQDLLGSDMDERLAYQRLGVVLWSAATYLDDSRGRSGRMIV